MCKGFANEAEADEHTKALRQKHFVEILVAKGKDKILGATIVAPHAGDMLSEITLAMVANVGLGTIATVIHPYPTLAESIKKCGDAFNRTRLTTAVKVIFRKLMAARR